MKNHHYKAGHFLSGILALLLAVATTAFTQGIPPRISVHDAAIMPLFSPDSVVLDSTLVILVRAENRGRYVEEAMVSLVDSASGDTIENWYPLLPPESADSTLMFWNTKGAKAGKHTLKAVLVIPLDSKPADNEQKRTVKVIPWR
jgi:hypothetical protein